LPCRPLAVRRAGAQQLAALALGPDLDLGRPLHQVGVFGLAGIGGHRLGLVADVLDLVDLVRLGQRLAGGVIPL